MFDNLALLFAIGISVGLAEKNNGGAGLVGAIGYLVLTKVAGATEVARLTSEAVAVGVTTKGIKSTIDMGVLAGFISGITRELLYNKFKDIQVPRWLGFFGGKKLFL